MEFMSSLQNGFDEHKPSLFELLSEQQLAALIPPSLRYLLAVATHRHPRYLLRVLNSFDEIYALLMLAVERHYLQTYGGSFTENFYGLKRERILRIKGGEAPRASIGAPALMRETLKLRPRDVWKNLAIMVGLPYIKRKLDESYEIHAPETVVLGPSYNRNAFPPNANVWQRIIYYYKWFLRNVYPGINAAYYFSLLAFNLAYLFDNTKFSSPFLWLIGTRIRRLGAADHHAIALAAQTPTPRPDTGTRPGQTNSLLNPLTLATKIYPRLLSSLNLLLPTSIFALKFLEWWHASDFARQLSRKATEGLHLPPPLISNLSSSSSSSSPDPSSKTPAAAKHSPPLSSTSRLPILTVPASPHLCPICLLPIQTPTAAQTGHVFCYTCIFKWVGGTHERQAAFMDGRGAHEGWGDEEGDQHEHEGGHGDGHGHGGNREKAGSRGRQGKWESGKGRCAVTGRRVLGGTDGLRRVMM